MMHGGRGGGVKAPSESYWWGRPLPSQASHWGCCTRRMRAKDARVAVTMPHHLPSASSKGPITSSATCLPHSTGAVSVHAMWSLIIPPPPSSPLSPRSQPQAALPAVCLAAGRNPPSIL